MNPRITTALLVAAIVLGGMLLYATALDRVPPYLIHDEAQGALHAHAIASTGRDQDGRLLPMYFSEPGFPAGRDPMMIYVTALGLQVLPFTEAGVRTPTALVAVLNIVLMFFAARAIFQNTWIALLAAALLALTPIHFIRGRLLLSPLYSIPFVLAWLWSLRRFEEHPSAGRFVAACAWLALGAYSYLGAIVMLPLYLLMTIAIAARSLGWRTTVLSGATFAVGLLPMALWYATHPARNAQIVSAYQLGAGSALLEALGSRLDLYWRFFDPAYLFVSGDPSLINSTRTAGLFPMAFAVLLPLGLIAIVRERRPMGWILATGFVTAPVVTVISGAIEMNRVMFVIPFAVLVATWGVWALWQNGSMRLKVVAALLIAAIAVQFAGFYRYYMGPYRTSAAPWFSGHVSDAMRELIARSGGDAIFISREIEWADPAWRFAAIEAGRADLISRTTHFSAPPAAAAPGSKAMCPAESAQCAAMAASGAWHEVIRVPAIAGTPTLAILERTARAQ
ncbi:MAG: glycosyltransferase family 39 protein [Cyanobacteria bacterium]|nr:glycosyltransferase family 39 protein [Cyanobacteriota bacterium]